MTSFNAARARAKRPCPLWVDAFQRDTQHLGADEVGAYMLILMAMWTRESCDFPDDDARLAKVCRVSLRLWKSRIGPVLMPFFHAESGAIYSKRLRIEAEFTERTCKAQSDRKTGSDKKSDPYAKPTGNNEHPEENGENSANTLENIERDQSTDVSAESPQNHPTQLPNYPTLDGGGDSASAPKRMTPRERILEAIGVDPVSGLTGRGGAQLGKQVDMIDAGKWVFDLGLSWDEIITEIRDVMSRKHDGPPSSFKFFEGPMRRLAAAKAAPPLTPSAPVQHDHAGPQPTNFDPLQFLRDRRAVQNNEAAE